MLKLLLIYDSCLIYKTSYEGRKAFLGTVRSQNRTVVF